MTVEADERPNASAVQECLHRHAKLKSTINEPIGVQPGGPETWATC
jgi:hypothetical protein